MQRWEYTLIRHEKPSDEDLDQLGNDGWELVTVYVSYTRIASSLEHPFIPQQPTWVFKRPKED